MEKICQTKTVLFEGQQAPINLLPTIALDGYQIKPFTLEGEAKNRASGAFFEIEPNSHTAVAKITESGVQLIEHAIKGNGWFLSISPTGEINQTYIDTDRPWSLNYGTGYAFCFFTRTRGLTVQNLTWPPFRPDMEKIITEDSKELTKVFWKAYHSQLNELSPQAAFPQLTQK